MNPRLAAADSEMAKAYSALRALLPKAQRAALLDSQREWIGQRDGACQDKGSQLTQCLLEQTQVRRRFLAGEGPNDDIGMPRPVAGVPSRGGRSLPNLDPVSANPQLGRRYCGIIQQRESKIAFGTAPGGAASFRNNGPLPNSEAKNLYDASLERRQ